MFHYKALLIDIRILILYNKLNEIKEACIMAAFGIYHVSAITIDISNNHDFFTKILGHRLVKKTVNQDDPSMYHLFYSDYKGSPGTDVTFFEIGLAPKYTAG